jgi:hypothetical protein
MVKVQRGMIVSLKVERKCVWLPTMPKVDEVGGIVHQRGHGIKAHRVQVKLHGCPR